MLVDNPWQARPTSGVEASLNGAELPPIYEKALRLCNPSHGKVPLTTLRSLIALGGLSPATSDQIINRCISPGETMVNRNTFKLTLALVALAQKNMDPSFDNVQDYINDLPAPTLPGLDSFGSNIVGPSSMGRSSSGTLRSAAVGSSNSGHNLAKSDSRNSIRYLSDPWQIQQQASQPPPFSTSTFDDQLSGEGSLINSTHGVKSIPASLSQSNFGREEIPPEIIAIHPHDQLEGFLFKHINYVVTSERHGSRVLRRYSEFFALYQYLIARYPYRLIPDIPPKRIGVTEEFLEKRRLGLIRFLGFVTNHPTLGNDPYLKSFLTDVELTGRFSSSISGKAEPNEVTLTVNRYLPEEVSDRDLQVDLPAEEGSTFFPSPQLADLDLDLELEVPSNLEPQMDNLASKLRGILQHYSTMITVVDRIARRSSADAEDLAELSRNNARPLSNHELERDPYPSDAYFPDEQFPFIMLYLQKLGIIMANNSEALNESVVETLKCLRDAAQGLYSLLVRMQSRPLFDGQRVIRRVKNNRLTYNFLSKEPNVASAELAQLRHTIQIDQRTLLTHQLTERAVRSTVWREYLGYRDYQLNTTLRLLQSLVNDQINFCNLSVHNWRRLADQLALQP